MLNRNDFRGASGVTITFRFSPGSRWSEVLVFMASGLNRTYKREDLWRGSIPTTTGDLHGLTRRQVAFVLSEALGEVWLASRYADQQADLADGVTTTRPQAPAPPEGATGAAVPDIPLPGL